MTKNSSETQAKLGQNQRLHSDRISGCSAHATLFRVAQTSLSFHQRQPQIPALSPDDCPVRNHQKTPALSCTCHFRLMMKPVLPCQQEAAKSRTFHYRADTKKTADAAVRIVKGPKPCAIPSAISRPQSQRPGCCGAPEKPERCLCIVRTRREPSGCQQCPAACRQIPAHSGQW